VIAAQRFSDATVAPTRPAEAEAQHGNWQRLAAVIAAIVLISFAAGWIAAGPTGRKQFLDIFVGQQSDSSPQPENPGATSAERDAPVAVTHETASAQTDAAASPSSATAANPASSQPVTQTPVLVAKEQPAGITPENIPAKKQPNTATASTASSASNRSQQQPQPTPAAISLPNSSSAVTKNTPPPATSTSAPKPADSSTPKTSAPGGSSPTTGAAVRSSPSPNANPPAAQPPARSDGPSPASQPKLAVPSEIVKGTVSVTASPFPSIRIPSELKSQISKQGASLQIGQLLSRVEPTYPEDAERQRIEGVVKLHAIIARDGSIQDIDQTSGPPLLVAAAANAVRQWRYKPTSLDGQPVEATESVTVTFRLQTTRAN
jgi:protein TonB